MEFLQDQMSLKHRRGAEKRAKKRRNHSAPDERVEVEDSDVVSLGDMITGAAVCGSLGVCRSLRLTIYLPEVGRLHPK